MEPEYVISLSSEESDGGDDDVEILEFRKETQNLLNQTPPPNMTKRLIDVQCPICFDEITLATTTSCGHIFCLECIQMSISSSNARGQTRGKNGVGLCPLCRKRVAFKDTIVLRMKKSVKVGAPKLPSKPKDDQEIDIKAIKT